MAAERQPAGRDAPTNAVAAIAARTGVNVGIADLAGGVCRTPLADRTVIAVEKRQSRLASVRWIS